MKYSEHGIKYPSKEFGEVNVKRECKYNWDDYKNDGSHEVEDQGWEIYLQHSCDEWVIGGVGDAKTMKENLEKAIEYCETNN